MCVAPVSSRGPIGTSASCSALLFLCQDCRATCVCGDVAARHASGGSGRARVCLRSYVSRARCVIPWRVLWRLPCMSRARAVPATDFCLRGGGWDRWLASCLCKASACRRQQFDVHQRQNPLKSTWLEHAALAQVRPRGGRFCCVWPADRWRSVALPGTFHESLKRRCMAVVGLRQAPGSSIVLSRSVRRVHW